MRTLLLIAALLGTTATAEAACFLQPESASSHYVENNAAYALCLQRELAASTAQSNALTLQQGANNLAIQQMQRRSDMELQSRLRQQALQYEFD